MKPKKKKQIRKKRSRLIQFLNWPIYIAVLMAAANGILAFLDQKAAATMLAVTLGAAFLTVILQWYQRTRVYQDVLDITNDNTLIQHEILKELPIPYGMLDQEGRILWGNDRLQDLFNIPKNSGRQLWDIVPEFKKKDFPLRQDLYHLHIKIGDNYFRLVVEKIRIRESIDGFDGLEVRDDDGGLYTVYLFDETVQVTYEREREEEKAVVALIYLDNYDEVLESIEEVRRSLMIALIDRRINRYVTQNNGLMKKLEKDKYLVILKKKNLSAMKEDRFALLEDVKKVSIGNDLSVTVSIGVGLEGNGYNQNYEYARAAIDMALGRGGDQAVIREGDAISYYGGKTQTMEKNTRVKARVKAHALKELIENSEKVLIMGHRIGDVDAFGAGVGVQHICMALGKPAYIVADTITAQIRPMLERIQSQIQNQYKIDEPLWISGEKAVSMVDDSTLVVVVDVNRPSITECPDILNRGADVVVLDHHREMAERIENAVLAYVEPYASSACELVAEILQYIDEDLHLTSGEADLMYAGIVVDTNNFVNKAGVRTFEAAAYLRRNGADVVRVRKMLRDNMDDYKARAAAVSKAEIFAKSYAVSECISDGLESPTVVGAQAANELLNIVGVKASFVLTLYNNIVYISARSIDEVNVQVIMEKFGGGGHMTIAGAQIKDSSIAEVKELLKQTVTKMVEEGDI